MILDLNGANIVLCFVSFEGEKKQIVNASKNDYCWNFEAECWWDVHDIYEKPQMQEHVKYAHE